MTVDEEGFQAEMEAQKTRSKEAEAARRYVRPFSYTCRNAFNAQDAA